MQHIYTYAISVMNAIIHPNIHIIVYIICSKLYSIHTYNHNDTVLYALARSMKYR